MQYQPLRDEGPPGAAGAGYYYDDEMLLIPGVYHEAIPIQAIQVRSALPGIPALVTIRIHE